MQGQSSISLCYTSHSLLLFRVRYPHVDKHIQHRTLSIFPSAVFNEMTDLQITDADIPLLEGKIAIVTGKPFALHQFPTLTTHPSGGSSGIGLATTILLATKRCRVFILDLKPPSPDTPLPPNCTFVRTDVTRWGDLVSAFQAAGEVDIAIANAGISETTNTFGPAPTPLPAGVALPEPSYPVLDINLRAVLNVVKLALHYFRTQGPRRAGSIVITASATAYAPEQSLPVYSAAKLALIGLVRSLRASLWKENISINAVAPAATMTELLPRELAAPLMAAGLPVSTAAFVGRAIVWSAVGRQERMVEAYGKDEVGEVERAGRWNGRVVVTLGERYTEVEEAIAGLREKWFGAENARLTRSQQAATDFRGKGLLNEEVKGMGNGYGKMPNGGDKKLAYGGVHATNGI